MNKFGVAFLKFLFVSLIAMVLWQCNPDPPMQNKPVIKTPNRAPIANQRKVPKFEQDSAYAHIQKQISFGPRVPNMEGHKACKTWLVNKLQSYKATVIEQDFQADSYYGVTYNGTNIIAQYNPEVKDRILLAAHWDTRHIAEKDDNVAMQEKPIDGADDGASGVGVLLEIARLVSANGIDIGLDIILFDAEDNGISSSEAETEAEYIANNETWCLGSQYWGKNPHSSNYKARFGILLDMVGAKEAYFPLEGHSLREAGPLLSKVWDLAKTMGFGNYFVSEKGGTITDDHYYVMKYRKIPMIDIINLSPKSSQSFGDHHHTHDDNLDVIDKRTLKAVGRVVTAALYRQNNGTLQ